MSEKYIEAARDYFNSLIPLEYLPPCEWAENKISFKQDITASRDKFDLSLTPYLRDPISCWEFRGHIREITVVAIEQTGKTLSWIVPLLWTFEYMPCLSLICYTSDDKAEEINEEKIQPLMREIPRFKKELAKPRSFRKDRYKFSTLISYYQGSGARITSKSAKIRIADEVDDWVEHDEQVTKLQDLRKRARSFDESIFAKVCTCSGTKNTSKIWQEFLKSSQGYWHLRCVGCGKLSMRSCDVHNMQWQCDDEENVIKNSIELICPACGHSHKETDKKELNVKGKYIHRNSALKESLPGFQWGALASQFRTLDWYAIASAQMQAGRSGDVETQMYFDNSIRGLPWKRRQTDDVNIRKIMKRKKTHFEHKYLLLSVDTQDTHFYYIIRGIDNHVNSCLVDAGRVDNFDELTKIYKSQYNNRNISQGIVDTGGHRIKEVMSWVKQHKGLFGYKGNTRISVRWKPSKNVAKLIIAHPKRLQAELLYYIYSAEEKDNNNWYISPNPPEMYLEQMADVRPDNKKKNGNEYENWTSSGNDHLFDCEKQWLVLKDIFLQALRKTKKSPGS